MNNATMRALTLMRGLFAHTARPRAAMGATLGIFPGQGAPTRWSEITGFSVRHHY